MKTFSIDRIFDQKRLPSHLMIIGVSIFIPLISSLFRPVTDFPEHQIRFFILLFVQLELFIFVAAIIFRRLNTGATRKEFTRIVLSRLFIFMVSCFVIALIVNLLIMSVIDLIMGYSSGNEISYFFHNEFDVWFKATIGGLLFGTALFIFIQWQAALNREQILKEENLIFQNSTLKNQVNPHFLFNSLNTLSSLISTQPEVAENFTNRLSAIYRYILENISRDKVSLDEELSFIKDYFFLHKIRDDEKIELEINISENGKFDILPVSLQILIENAIKHNRATREEPLKISIFNEGNAVVVKNNLQKMATQIKSTGIGLKNLAERVRLISGKELIIEETNSYFLVKVPLLK